MHKHNLISILIPTISVILIVAAFIFIKPTTTGLLVYSPNGTRLVNADVILKTKSTEVIPKNAIVQVSLDDSKSQMTIGNFIYRTGENYTTAIANLSDMGYYGPGFTGDYTYRLNLSEFSVNRNIGKGEHVFITRIIYANQVLYEKQNRIMISE